MIRKAILITAFLFFIPVLIFAGTLFEDEKKTSDPFIAERGGFNSLFVNPAGAHGKSGFELAATAGVRTTSDDINLIINVVNLAYNLSQARAKGLSKETIALVGNSFAELYDKNAVTGLLDSLFTGTGLSGVDWSDSNAVKTAINSLTPQDTENIKKNISDVVNGTNTAFYGALPGKFSVQVLAGFKTGFLIKGFGLGIYDQATAVAYANPATRQYGLKTVYNELGVITGGGFNILDGKLSLGFTANYGILMRNISPVSFFRLSTLINGSINYGYTWGLDLGAIWRPTPSIGVGIVLNDVIGYTQADTPYNAAGFAGFFNDDAYLMKRFDYKFTMDIDAGITWQPDWGFVKPKFSLDVYNVIGYGRTLVKNQDNLEGALYRSLEHIRIGANFTFFKFLKLGTQYYNHYLSAGLGLDLLFLELYGEFKIHDEGTRAASLGEVPIGGDLTVRIHF